MSNAMKNYRNNGVTPGTVPVLVPCGYRRHDGFASFEASFHALRPVRVLRERALEVFKEDGRRFQDEYGHIPDDESVRLLGLLQLAGAVRSGNDVDMRVALSRLATSADPMVRYLQERLVKANPSRELSREISKGTRRVRLVLWYDPRGNLLPGLYCPDIVSGLYSLALVTVAGGKGLGACLYCGKTMLRLRGTRKTCSDRCKQRLFRERRQVKKMPKRKR